jgi:DNA-directed RNA polymerase subunit alpha
MTEIVLNLKQVRFRRQLEDVSTEKVSFTLTGKDSFTAGDIGKHTTGFQVLNPELLICHLEGNVKLNVEVTIGKGRGYVPADENKVEGTPIGTIYIDSIFTPIKNVKYSVDNTRVEQKTDYEKLTLELTTDGSISPKNALQEAAKILIHHFMLFSDERISLELEERGPGGRTTETEEFDETSLHMRQLLKTKLVDMDLSVRALNCLKAADIETLGDLVAYNKNDLLKFRNFGKKSLTELEDLVENKGLSFGMNVSKYKLDKE